MSAQPLVEKCGLRLRTFLLTWFIRLKRIPQSHLCNPTEIICISCLLSKLVHTQKQYWHVVTSFSTLMLHLPAFVQNLFVLTLVI